MMSRTVARSRSFKALQCLLPGFRMWCASSMTMVRKEWPKRVCSKDSLAVGRSHGRASFLFFLDLRKLFFISLNRACNTRQSVTGLSVLRNAQCTEWEATMIRFCG